MRGVISAPGDIITGAFNIRFAFQKQVDLLRDDVVVMPIEGDALGHAKDTFGGGGKDYHILCYLPDARKGKSRISVIKDGVNVAPVFIEYDTVREVTLRWGTPFKRGAKLEIPFTFDTPVRDLKKRNFRISYATAFQLYGSGDAYSLVIPNARDRFTVTALGSAVKENGVVAEIQETDLEIDQSLLSRG